MKGKAVEFLLAQPWCGDQRLQRRCFVISSFRNKDLVAEIVARLRSPELFVFDFTAGSLDLGGAKWAEIGLEEARGNPSVSAAARCSLTFLSCLGPSDFVLLVLGAGFSAGWEVGFATARGAQVIVCSNGTEQVDVPLLHADHFFSTAEDAVDFILKSARR